MSPPAENERRDAGETVTPLRCAVVTVSDTGTLETDESGALVQSSLRASGHKVVERTVVPEDGARLAPVLRHWVAADIDVLVVCGDTSARKKESTTEMVGRFVDRELPAFGHIFSILAHRQVGAQAILLRAMAGLARDKLVFVVPGARWAVQLCMEKLILSDLGRIYAETRR